MRNILVVSMLVLLVGCSQASLTSPTSLQEVTSQGRITNGTSVTLTLIRVPEQVIGDQWKEWFRADFSQGDSCPPPTFTVIGDTEVEAWPTNPFYGWIIGRPGTFVVTASSVASGCEAKAMLVIVIS